MTKSSMPRSVASLAAAHFISEGVLCHEWEDSHLQSHSRKVRQCRSSSTTAPAFTTRSPAAGKPLLLIAGTASDGASWGPLLPLLRGPAADPDRQPRLGPDQGRGADRDRRDGRRLRGAARSSRARRASMWSAIRWAAPSGSMLAARHPAKVARLVTMGSGRILGAERACCSTTWRGSISPWCRRTGSGMLYQWLFSDPFFTDEATCRGGSGGVDATIRIRQSPGDFARQVAALDRIGADRPGARSRARCWRLPANSICWRRRRRWRRCMRPIADLPRDDHRRRRALDPLGEAGGDGGGDQRSFLG